MPKRNRETLVSPSEATLHLLEPAAGITEVTDARLEPVAKQLLAMPQDEQIAAARWMGSQPQYASLLGYLLARVGVTGAVRRAVKRAIFELSRKGVQVSIPSDSSTQSDTTAPPTSPAWSVEEVYAAKNYKRSSHMTAFHFRFFLKQESGERAAYLLDIDAMGYLVGAYWTEDSIRKLYDECVNNPPMPARTGAEMDMGRNEFVSVPVDWALQVAYEARQRNLNDHGPMPQHVAYFWGRLPAPPDPPVPMPVDSIPDEETGWLLSSLISTQQHRVPTMDVFFGVLLHYSPPPDALAELVEEVTEETETRIVLLEQAEEERKKQRFELLLQKAFGNERLRALLEITLPLFGSLALLAGDRETAVWCKALWRELTERRDLPLWRTHTAKMILDTAYIMLTLVAGTNLPSQETNHEESPSPVVQ